MEKTTLIPREVHANEGFATLQCGDVKVVLSYTLLHNLVGWVAMGAHGYHGEERMLGELKRALEAVAVEASNGKTA